MTEQGDLNGETLGMEERGRPLASERIRQIEAEALAKLRTHDLRGKLSDYLD